MEFNSSQKSTIGVEIEFGIVDRQTGELVPASQEILDIAGADYPDGEHPKAKHELFLPSIEVITGICETPDEAMRDIAGTLSEIVPALNERGLALESTGTHPFAHWDSLEVTPNPRYLRMVERLRWPAKRLLIHGIHVHVGVRSAEKAIITNNVVAMYIPMLLALSTSSPFWKGRDTGLKSSRTKIFEGLPTTGVPPQLASWDDFNQLLDALINAGTIESVREVWWDVRPHPNFGTIEFRMCDGITSLKEIATVAAFAQSLVTWIDRQVDAGKEIPLLPDWVIRDNKWRATRYGTQAELVIDRAGNTVALLQRLRETVAMLMPIAEELGCADELAYALVIAEQGSSSDRQRAVYEETGSTVEVVKALIRETDRAFADYGVKGAAENLDD